MIDVRLTVDKWVAHPPGAIGREELLLAGRLAVIVLRHIIINKWSCWRGDRPLGRWRVNAWGDQVCSVSVPGEPRQTVEQSLTDRTK
jgi:hypothetical protein